MKCKSVDILSAYEKKYRETIFKYKKLKHYRENNVTIYDTLFFQNRSNYATRIMSWSNVREWRRIGTRISGLARIL